MAHDWLCEPRIHWPSRVTEGWKVGVRRMEDVRAPPSPTLHRRSALQMWEVFLSPNQRPSSRGEVEFSPADGGPPIVPEPFWDHPPLQRALEQRHMGRVIREFRLHPYHGRRPLSQERMAEWIGVTQSQLSRVENGPPIIHLDRLIQLATILRVPARKLWYFLPEPSLSHQSVLAVDIRVIPATPATQPLLDIPSPLLDSPLDTIQRMQSIGTSSMDQSTLTELESVAADAIDDYERVGPAAIAPTLVMQRRWVHQSLLERHPPRVGVRLFTLAAHMSGVLASIALDLQSFRMARSYAAEAFQLSTMVGDPHLSAWIRGTQSLIEYYARHYDAALEFARDGLRIAPSGPQTIRLKVNGEARALARLGDKSGVDAAVERAIQLHEDLPFSPDVSSSLALGPYCSARIHGNAATAYLNLLEPDRVLLHGEKALEVFDPMRIQGPRALTRLDMATALLQADHPDPPYAAHIALDALSIEGAEGFAAVSRRAEEFLVAAAPYRDITEISAVEQKVHDLVLPALTDSTEEGIAGDRR